MEEIPESGQLSFMKRHKKEEEEDPIVNKIQLGAHLTKIFGLKKMKGLTYDVRCFPMDKAIKSTLS